jgi:apolipoprotein N-acyltransferase
VLAVCGFGAAALRAERPPAGPPTRIAVVQANLGAATRWEEGGGARTLDAYGRLTLEAFARDAPVLVFWPEAALTSFLEREPLQQRALGRLLAAHGAELVLGAPRAEGGGPDRNSVYLVGPEGALRARYDKELLLPFMEYFPLRLDLVRRRFGRTREYAPGAPTPPLPTRAGPAGILVCNEALLPHVAARRSREGAALLVNPSNDSWVSDAGFAEQQLDIVVLRAVETRTPLVRASDSGPSAVVDPLGRVLARTAPLTRDVLLADLAPGPGGSVYTRVGDLFGAGCVGAVALALAASRGSRDATT